MKEIQIKVSNDSHMVALGQLLTSYMYPNLVVALNGDLGAGKTTFTKGIGLALGIKRVINSPTFTIMKIYDPVNKVNNIEKLYHLDVYRIKSSADDFELSEYFELGGVTIVEWSDIIEDLLPESLWKMEILRTGDESRLVKLQIIDDITNEEAVVKSLKGANYEVIY